VCGEPLLGELSAGGGSGGSQLVLGSVTAMDYGIETEGGKFEVIIPKNSPYPMPAAVKERFRTSAPNLRRLRVPVFAGSTETPTENDLQATIWLELPEGIAENTPVEVSFSLDDSGILRNVKVNLLDGSGIQVDTYLDRGDTERARLEKKLDQLRTKKEEAKSSLSTTELDAWEQAYGQAAKALNQGDNRGAADCAKDLEKRLQTLGPKWKQDAEFACWFTEWALDYSFLMEPTKVQRLNTLLKEVRTSIERADEVATGRNMAALNKEADDLPELVNAMIYLDRAVFNARQQGLQTEADRVQAAKNEIETALRAGNTDHAYSCLNVITPLAEKILATDMPVAASAQIEGELRR